MRAIFNDQVEPLPPVSLPPKQSHGLFLCEFDHAENRCNAEIALRESLRGRRDVRLLSFGSISRHEEGGLYCKQSRAGKHNEIVNRPARHEGDRGP